MGINEDGKKEVLSIQIGENEISKYWLVFLNKLKNSGVKDILILCSDGLTGIKESISVAFPNTKYQRCIVHQVRNTLKHVSDKHRNEFDKDLKLIYHAATEEQGYSMMLEITEKWQNHYPNAIESLNSSYHRLNRQRSVFPSNVSLLKALYLTTFEATKKWTLPLRNWGKVYGELSIMYERRQ